MPRPGDVLLDRLELVESIGAGGTANVFRAFDRRTASFVAVKLLRRPDQLVHFKREFRVHLGFSHPNVLAADELLVAGQLALIILPLQRPERRLDRAIAELPPSSTQLTCGRWFAELAQAVRAMHRQGLLHCDIKPANVFIDEGGSARLLDFGATRAIAGAAGDQQGTAAYLAPEVALGGAPSEASDWYSFGTVLWQALARELPFRGSRASVIEAKTSGEAPRLLAPNMPSAWVALAQALVRRSPAERATPRQVFETFGIPLDEGGVHAPVYVGRSEELSRLRRELDLVVQTGARLVDVRGESGIGKTALCEEFCRTLASFEPRPFILTGVCSEFAFVPYNALDSAVDQLCEALGDNEADLPALLGADASCVRTVFPAMRRALPGSEVELHIQPSELRRRAFDGIARALAELMRSAPVVLVLDQLQWADGDSAEMLDHLLEHSARKPLLVLQVCRDDGEARSEYLKRQSAKPRAVPVSTLFVGALSSQEASLLANRCGVADAESIVAEARGNPQTLLQFALRSRYWERLVPAALETAQFLAVGSQELPQALVTSALGPAATSPGVLRALDESGLARRVERAGEAHFVPVHDRTLTLLKSSLAPERQRRLHFVLASELAKQEPVPHGSVARHLLGAGRRDLARPHALAAATTAREAVAFETEAQWLEIARDETSPSSVETQQLTLRIAEAYAHAGYGDKAAREYLRLAAARPEQAPRYRVSAVHQLFRSGRRDEAFALLDDLLREAGLAVPQSTPGAMLSLALERWRLRSLNLAGPGASPKAEGRPDFDALLQRADVAAAAKIGYMSLDLLRGAYFAAMALRLAIATGDEARIAVALCDEVAFLANAGPSARSKIEPLLARARKLADQTANDRIATHLRVSEGAVLLQAGAFTQAMEVLRDAERSLRERHRELTWELTLCRMFYTTAAQFGGGAGTLAALLGGWLADAEKRNDTAAQRYLAPKLVFGHLALDHVDAAKHRLARALRGGRSFDHGQAALLNQRYFVAVYTGDVHALLALRSEFGRFHRSMVRFSQGLRCMAQVFEAGAELEIMARLGAGAARIGRIRANIVRLRKENTPYARANAALLQTTLRCLQGQPDGAERDLEAIAGALETAELPLAALSVRLRLEQRSGSGSRAAASLRAYGIVRPERFASIHAPGLGLSLPS